MKIRQNDRKKITKTHHILQKKTKTREINETKSQNTQDNKKLYTLW